MANYYESARSNYFTVRNIEEFTAELKGSGLEILGKEVEGGTQVALFADLDNGFPAYKYDEDGEETELVWEEIFAKHLLDGEVAIFMGAGAEKLRYVNGWAMAFNNKGGSKFVSLDTIYELAKELGDKITEATY